MKAIIFGANGQDGHYLCNMCEKENIEAIGLSRSGNWLPIDVSIYSQVEDCIKATQPTYIFHLAAVSTTRHDALFENHNAIATGTLNILESVRKWSPQTRVFITGSGVQFKNNGDPINENDPFEGNSPYSVARIQSVYAARYYRSIGLRTYIGYLFHHESPLRNEDHLTQKIASAAKRIGNGSKEQVSLGDISVRKEYTYAGDVVRAMLMLVRQDAVFEAVIGSGIDYRVEDWLKECFSLVGKDWRSHVTIKDNFCPEYQKLVSDPKTINRMGWVPKVDLPELAQLMVTSKSLISR